MSTLFLIGNGFDLNCGMKTKYTDVYEKYIHEKTESDIVREFKESISGDIENWGDFEMAMAEYAQKLGSEEEFLECVRDFSIYMEHYLIEQNNYFRSLLKNEKILDSSLEELSKSLGYFYTGISHNIDVVMERRGASYINEFEAISFNYTDVFDYLWQQYFSELRIKRRNVTHIHGVLGDGPVLGVDNINQIKADYKLSRKGERGFVKPIFNNQYDTQRVNEAQEKIRSALTICVFGMSLGESDLSWRNEIIDWLKNDANHHLFIYLYSVSKAKFVTVAGKMDMEDDAKEELLAEWGIENGEEIYNQIHIPCGKNIFNIKEVLEEELIKIEAEKKAELEKRIAKEKEFIEKNSQPVVVG